MISILIYQVLNGTQRDIFSHFKRRIDDGNIFYFYIYIQEGNYSMPEPAIGNIFYDLFLKLLTIVVLTIA